jgi:mannosyltransferase
VSALSRHALLAITLGGAVLRFATLDQSFWLDEQATLDVLAGHGEGDGLVAMLKAVQVGESNPPVYYLLLWSWERLFGTSELAIRSLSALAGTVAIPVIYAGARALGSQRAAVIAAALTAASPLLVWYSQEARNYELFVLLAALSFLCFARALDDRDGNRWLWGWALASSLALSTHYFAFALIVPQAIWLLVRRRRRGLGDVGLGLATIGVVGIALLPLVATQRGRGSWIADYDVGGRLLQIPEHFLVGFTVPWQAIPLVAIAIVAALVAYAFARERDIGGLAIAWSVVAGGLAVPLVALAAGDDYILTRNLLALWPPFAIGLGLVLGSRSLGAAGPVAAAALCLTGVALAIWTAATPAAHRPDHEALAEALGPAPEPRLIVSQTTFSSPLLHYLDGTRIASDADLVTDRLVVVEPKRTESYAVGTCWWLHTCGGEDLEPPPPFEVPAGFEETGESETDQYGYRTYEAPRPVAIERPLEYFTPRAFAQEPTG